MHQRRSWPSPSHNGSPQLPAIFDKIRNFLAPGTKLGCHLAAVYENRGAGNVRGEIRGEKGDGIAHLFRRTAASQRNVAKVLFDERRIDKKGFRQTRANETRTNGVDANLPGTEFIRGRVQNSQDASFTRVVGDQRGLAV